MHKYLHRVPYDNFIQRYGLIANTRLAQGDEDDISILFLNFLLSALSLCNLFSLFLFLHLQFSTHLILYFSPYWEANYIFYI